MNTSKHFKINQSKIFLNNNSFLKLENDNDDDSIIEKDFDLEGTQQNLLKLSFTSKNQPKTTKSKLNKIKQQQIPASAIYSTAMHLKSDLEKEFLKNNNLLKDRKNSSLSSDRRQEVLTVLQYPIQLKNKNDNLNNIPPELSFLKFDDIEKVNSSFLGNDKQCLSLPKLYRKYEILKSGKQNQNLSNEKSFWNEPKTFSPSKMALDIEITHNKQVHKEISNLFNKQREDSFARVESKRNDYRKQLLKLPIIRSYPTVKVKNISYKMAKELEDFDSKEGGLAQSTVSSDKNTKNITKDKPFRIYWQLKEIYTWKPEVRESASFILDGRKGYLYGGLGTRIMDDVLCIDFDLMQWSKIPDSGDKYTMGKYGHTAVKYKKKMIVYGGGTSYQSQLRQKECLGEVRVLNLEDFSWNWIKCGGDIITPRRHHTAEVIGKHMIVHGGINYKNVVLNDLWIFDLNHYKWFTSQVKSNIPSISDHSVSSVYYLQRTRLEIYKGIDRKIAENNGDIIKYEGIYYFGGKNEKLEATNTLYILEVHKNPMNWFIPETFGKCPTARYGHSSNFCPLFGLYVIFGGKNDKYPGKPFSNDLNILNLNNMNWLRIRVYGTNNIIARAFHNTTLINSELFIFGGYNSKGYINNEINIVELDSKTIRFILKTEKEKKLVKQLQEQILREKMERHKKSKIRQRFFEKKNTEQEEIKETEETDEDQEMEGEVLESFDDLSDDLKNSSRRKGATILSENIDQLLNEKLNKQTDKWKNIMESLTYKNFVSYVPLPYDPKENVNRSKINGRSVSGQHLEINKEKEIKNLITSTGSEKNIKVYDTLRLISNK